MARFHGHHSSAPAHGVATHEHMVSEATGKNCNLPTEVIEREFPEKDGFEHTHVKSLYSFVESQEAENRSELQRYSNPKKI
jgi:hypothetical protein